MTNIAEQTLATIVSNNNKTVPVLEKHNLDYCCRGKRTLTEACLEKHIPVEKIIQELQQFTNAEVKPAFSFNTMNAEQLINYIVLHHHFYVRQSMPLIISHLEKVAAKHGDSFPYMRTVLELFNEINKDMTSHMEKEEAVLFPRIKGLENLFTSKTHADIATAYISAPINVMETEHDQAGRILSNIRELTNDYAIPTEACTTFRIVLSELKDFEEDLHRHIHLENNLLFPLANNMIQSLNN